MERHGPRARRLGRPVGGAITAVLAIAIGCGPAWAHIERTAYWPDPRPDDSISPAAGGAVPKVRALASALNGGAPGTTRVVCQADSLGRAEDAIAAARDSGYRRARL